MASPRLHLSKLYGRIESLEEWLDEGGLYPATQAALRQAIDDIQEAEQTDATAAVVAYWQAGAPDG